MYELLVGTDVSRPGKHVDCSPGRDTSVPTDVSSHPSLSFEKPSC